MNRVFDQVRSLFQRSDAPITVDGIHIGGDTGDIVIGHGNRLFKFMVNLQFGSVIKRSRTTPIVNLRDVKTQPPRALGGFVGREIELGLLERRIAAQKAVLIIGPDGIGKTSLMKQVVNGAAAKAMRDGVVLIPESVDRESASSRLDDLLQRLFNVLFDSDPQLKVDRDIARTYLSNTQPVIALDQVDLPDSELSSLPDYFPNGAILATSQGSIQSDVFETLELTPLPRTRSMLLLADKAGMVQNSANTPILDELCALLGDVPIALTLTGNMIRKKGMAPGIAADHLRRIDSSSRNPVEAAIERSNEFIISQLDREEHAALATAASTPGLTIDREVLETLSGEGVADSLEDLEILQANSPRFRLPGGLKRFAQPTSHGTTTLRGRLLEQLTNQVEARPLDFDYIEAEYGNIIGLMQWTGEEQRWSDVITLGRAIDPYLTLRGYWGEWYDVIQQVLNAADMISDVSTRGWALHQLGTREGGIGNLPLARNYLEQALATRKANGDRIGAAYTQHNLWVLFPPPPFRRKPGDGTAVGRSGLAWIIPILIVIAAIIAGWIFWNNRWRTYTNNNHQFSFMYPREGILMSYDKPSDSIVADLTIPTAPNDRYDKSLRVIANPNRREYPCLIPMTESEWAVQSVMMNDIQFLRAVNTNQGDDGDQYEIYATQQDGNAWVCLVFTYSERKPGTEESQAGQSESDTTEEIEIFRDIATTFRWLGPPPIVPPLTPATATTHPTDTENPSPISPVPATTTAAPTTITPSYTPTDTPSPTPTYTNTPCIPQPGWLVYVVQYGDTLFQISLWYSNQGITVADIQKANCKLTTDIYASERLLVPGAPPPATIAGYVFADPNQNLVQDPGEQRLSNVSVSLTNANGTIVDTTITDSNGDYEFTGVPYGYYYIFQFQVYVRPDQIVSRNFGVAPSP